MGAVTREHQTDDEGRCLNLGCAHALEQQCYKGCETEEQVLDQIYWLRKLHWTQKHPWMAKVVKVEER